MCAIDGGLCHAWLAAIPFGGWLVAAGRCWWHSRKDGTKPQRPINPTLSLSIDSTISRLFEGTFLESNEPECDECGGDCTRTDADGRATDAGGYPLKGSDWRIVRSGRPWYGEGEQS